MPRVGLVAISEIKHTEGYLGPRKHHIQVHHIDKRHNPVFTALHTRRSTASCYTLLNPSRPLRSPISHAFKRLARRTHCPSLAEPRPH